MVISHWRLPSWLVPTRATETRKRERPEKEAEAEPSPTKKARMEARPACPQCRAGQPGHLSHVMN